MGCGSSTTNHADSAPVEKIDVDVSTANPPVDVATDPDFNVPNAAFMTVVIGVLSSHLIDRPIARGSSLLNFLNREVDEPSHKSAVEGVPEWITRPPTKTGGAGKAWECFGGSGGSNAEGPTQGRQLGPVGTTSRFPDGTFQRNQSSFGGDWCQGISTRFMPRRCPVEKVTDLLYADGIGRSFDSGPLPRV